ncbi:MAG: VOC family protein [Aeromicrobium sp.]
MCDGLQQVRHFWSEALGWPLVWDQDEETVIQSPQGGTKIAWGGPPGAPKTGEVRLHFDLVPAMAPIDWVALADPDDNEFCLLSPG